MIPNDETGYSFVRPFSRFSSANFSRDPITGGRNFYIPLLRRKRYKKTGYDDNCPLIAPNKLPGSVKR